MPTAALRSLPLISAMLVSGTLLNVAEAMVVAPDPTNVEPFFTFSPFTITEVEDVTSTTGTDLYGLMGNSLDSGGDVLNPTASGLGIAITSASGSGTWQYSVDPAASPAVWVPFGNVSASNALLLAMMSAPYNGLPLAVRFIPNANVNGTIAPALTFRAWDGQDQAPPSDSTPRYINPTSTAYAVSTTTANLTITAVNDAPVQDTARDIALNSTYRNNTTDNGTAIADLVASGVTDVDGTTGFNLAIIGANGAHGTWEISQNGGSSWAVFSPTSVSSTNALVLSGKAVDNHRIRFLPSDNFIGTISNALTVLVTDESIAFAMGQTNTVPATRGGATAFSAASDIVRITITDSAGQTTSVPVSEPAVALSGPGQSIYTALCPSTVQGANSLLASMSGLGPTVVRAFTWNASARAYVELPAGSLQPYSGVFLATHKQLSFSFDGTPYSIGFTLTLAPNGWTFAGIPPIDLGVGNIQTSHPWAHFSLLLDTVQLDDATTPTFVQALGSSSAVAPTDNAQARPYWWDGTAYTQVTTLETGRGYWFKNNTDKPLSLVLSAASQAPFTRARSSSARALPALTLRDQGSPPPPPSGSQSSSADQGRGCGTGSGIAAFAMLMLLGLWSRFVGRR